jgi:pectinesterase
MKAVPAAALFALLLSSPTQSPAALPPGWPAYASAVVAADGSGQFRSLQDAIAAAPSGRPGRPWIIHVRPGAYRERLYVQRETRFLALVGDDPEKTIVSFDLHANVPGTDGKPIGTFRTATARSTPTTSLPRPDLRELGRPGGPGAGRPRRWRSGRLPQLPFRRLAGHRAPQPGAQYFEGCFVSGHVDFIFGAATAFFDRCTILVRRDGYVTAASTPEDAPHGFVFSRSTVRGESGEVKTYLGRPWRSFASVVFLGTEMSEVVRPEGWHNWNRPERERTARYAEHGSTGPGAKALAFRGESSAAEAGAHADSRSRRPDGWDPRRRAASPAAPAPPVAGSSASAAARLSERRVRAARRRSLARPARRRPGPVPGAPRPRRRLDRGDRAGRARCRRRLSSGIAWLRSYRCARHTIRRRSRTSSSVR